MAQCVFLTRDLGWLRSGYDAGRRFGQIGLLKIGMLYLSDFDEETADDWDVDMSVYYNKGRSGEHGNL